LGIDSKYLITARCMAGEFVHDLEE
jgi:hypothetical protein